MRWILLALLLPFSAFAQEYVAPIPSPVPTEYRFKVDGYAAISAWSTSTDAKPHCVAVGGASFSRNSYGLPSPGLWGMIGYCAFPQMYYEKPTQAEARCPSGSTWNGTACAGYVCPEGSTGPDAQNRCVKNPKCPMYPAGPGTPDNQPAGCNCPAGTKWQFGEGCRKQCEANNVGGVANAGWDLAFQGGSQNGCFAGCEVQQKAGSYEIAKNGTVFAQGTYTGWACSGNGEGTKNPEGPPEPDAPSIDKDKKHRPPCAGAENVVTSSNGTLNCVPDTTPNTNKPDISKKKKVETFPDNSTKTTEETKTTDPNTQVSETNTTTTGTGGQSGLTGTTSSTETDGKGPGGTGEGDGDGDGEDGCDASKYWCNSPGTAGIYQKKSETFQGPLQKFADGVRSSVIGSNAANFFNVTIPGGACPNWSVRVDYLNITINLSEYFCNNTAVNMMNVIGSVLMLVAAFSAFRWAIL